MNQLKMPHHRGFFISGLIAQLTQICP